MKAKLLLMPVCLTMCAMLCSCGIIPEEEEVRTAPVVKAYQKEIHTFATVQRGALSVTEKVTCRYVPVKTENLYFALGGEVVDKVLVKVGDMVEEGQLLAQLELYGLDEEIAQAEIDVKESRARLENLEAQHDLRRRRGELEWQALSSSDRLREAQALEEALELEMRACRDALEIAEMALADLKEQLAQRQIRAPFSGALTYVREFEEGERNEFGIRAMELSDSTVSLFRAETLNWDCFEPGDVYEIAVDKTTYNIEVADEATLGIDQKEKVRGKRAAVYFVLQEPDFTLDEGDFGYIEVVLEHREDALHVPIGAVKASGDKNLVFYLDENGLRAYREVETGIKNAKRIEILSGVTEGEQIILD